MSPADPPAETGKLPRDALVLRPPLPPTVRFRRGLIIGLVGSASAGLLAVTFLAFRPVAVSTPGNTATVSPPARPGETVLNAAASYDTLPRFVVPPDFASKVNTVSPASPAVVTAERQDPTMQQQRAALTAPVLASLAHGSEAPVAASQASSVTAAATPNDEAQRKSDFAFAPTSGQAVDAHRLVSPTNRWLLSAGSVISASLITGVDSDLPGEITAQVTDRVFDSVTGETLLIPQGARLIGRSDNRVSYGQSRVLIAWQRLIFPDGSSMEIDSLPAGDAAGFTGLSDSVDHHEGRLAKGLALSTLLDVGSQLSIGSGSGSLARALRQSVQQGGSDVANQFASRNFDIQPTLRVRPGWPVTVVVREDLLLKPWKSE